MTTAEPDAEAFAEAIAAEALSNGADFALVFHSRSLLRAESLAAALARQAPALRYAGCSTAGEITPLGLEEGQAIAILFPRQRFTAVSTLIDDLSGQGIQDIAGRVEALKLGLKARLDGAPRDIFALCFIDGLSFAEEAVTSAIDWVLDDIPLIGGSAGDDLAFETTGVLCNGAFGADAAVVVLIATDVPFRVFKSENFEATDKKLVVTASDPERRIVKEFNAAPAAEEYAAAIGLCAADLSPMSFASHPVVVRVGGEHFCRSIQKVNPDGSLTFFCAIDDGIVLSLAQPLDIVDTARHALERAGAALGGIDTVLGFDCVLRRLDARNRQVYRDVSELYRQNRVIGFGTYGEQYRSMHLNQTLTGIAFGIAPRAAG